jgi:hypothetical protein
MSQFARPNPTNGQPTDTPGTLPGANNVNGIYLIDPVSGLPISPALNGAVNPGSTAFPVRSDSGAYAATAANTDYVIIPANSTRRFLQLQNTSASAVIYYNFGAVAYGTALAGFQLAAGALVKFDALVPVNELHIASASAGATVQVMEG